MALTAEEIAQLKIVDPQAIRLRDLHHLRLGTDLFGR